MDCRQGRASDSGSGATSVGFVFAVQEMPQPSCKVLKTESVHEMPQPLFKVPKTEPGPTNVGAPGPGTDVTGADVDLIYHVSTASEGGTNGQAYAALQGASQPMARTVVRRKASLEPIHFKACTTATSSWASTRRMRSPWTGT